MNRPRILITGKNGQLGYELARTFAAFDNIEVVALDRSQLDLTRPDQIRTVVRDLKPALIVNAAAYTAVDQAETEAALAMQVNAVAPGILAEEANRCDALMVHYSTDYVFAGDDGKPYCETDGVAPQSVYGKSKLAGELAVSAVAKRHLILRAAWLYSNRRHNFLLTMLRLARERDRLRIVDDQLGSPTWVRDVANATQQMVEFKNGAAELAVAGGVYHVTATGVTSWYAFADAIIRQTNDPLRRVKQVEAITTAQYNAPAKRPAYSVLSHDKLTAAAPRGHWTKMIRWP